MTRRNLLPVVAVLVCLCGAGTAAAQSPPPLPPAPVPVAVPAPTPDATTPAPISTPAPAAPRRGLDEWARPSARRQAAAWPELASADLSRDATRGDLDRAIGILTGTAPARNPAAPASAWTTNLMFVRALGLDAERRGIARLRTEDGARIRLPRYAASEILARELGLIYNRLSPQDGRERSRRETVRLADIAYALERARSVGSWQKARLARYRDIVLPAMSPQRLAVAQAALWQVGQPYIWGGDWPGAKSPWGAQAHGGFDCSGLVWWAFKGKTKASQMSLGIGLLGRTADQMAWERPGERVVVADLIPADLVFFGSGGATARKGSIEHTGIALGNGWMVHSSGSRGGVALSHLEDYWPSATAFGRRVAQLGP